MLWTRLIGSFTETSGSGLQFVGGKTASSVSTSTPTFSLTGLTGGLASAPAPGDIVIACVTFNNRTADRNISTLSNGYTEIADLYSAGFNSTSPASQLGIYYKVLTSSETSIQFNIGVSVQSRLAVHVWRGQNSTPLDATTTTATGIGTTSTPNPPSITTVTNNSIVIAVGSMAGDSENPLTLPIVSSGMENFFQAYSLGDSGIAIESIARPVSGAYNPAAFGGFGTSGDNGWCAATIALRPA